MREKFIMKSDKDTLFRTRSRNRFSTNHSPFREKTGKQVSVSVFGSGIGTFLLVSDPYLFLINKLYGSFVFPSCECGRLCIMTR